MEKQLSVKQAIRIAINNLKNLSIPIDLTNSVAVPIANTVELLSMCVEALKDAPPQEQTNEHDESVENMIEMQPESVELVDDSQ